MGDKTRGMYNKFEVTRTDGKSAPGEKHEGCEYFVLDVTHDPFAVPALRAYANACRSEYPLLAKDIDLILFGEEGTWQERVQAELNELTDRLVRLRQFIAMPEFTELPVRQCHLMLDQSHAMMQYADALSARLAEDKKNALPT